MQRQFFEFPLDGMMEESQIYTPVWTAATTNPVIADGRIFGRYALLGSVCKVTIVTVMGANTTFGSSTYKWSLPLPAKTVEADAPFFGKNWNVNQMAGYLGVAYAIDNSANGTITGFTAMENDGKNLVVLRFAESIIAAWNSTTPVTWAVNDLIVLNATYFWR